MAGSTQPAPMSASKLQTTSPPHVPAWSSLPPELRQMILEVLARQTSGWGACASVCREWQATLEKESFRRLKLQTSCLDDMGTMVRRRREHLVRHVWLNIDLRPYTCRSCTKLESDSWHHSNTRVVRRAIVKLFSILSRWPVTEGAELTLELSIQSPSDKEHYFKNLHFGGGDEHEHLIPKRSGNQNFYDSKHGWMKGRQVDTPNEVGLLRIFGPLYSLKFRESLPQVKVATQFMLRRQCRRNLEPTALGALFDALPRLQSLILEPWQVWDAFKQKRIWDPRKILCLYLFFMLTNFSPCRILKPH